MFPIVVGVVRFVLDWNMNCVISLLKITNTEYAEKTWNADQESLTEGYRLSISLI